MGVTASPPAPSTWLIYHTGGLYGYGKPMLESMLVNAHFQTWLMIETRLCYMYQPVSVCLKIHVNVGFVA